MRCEGMGGAEQQPAHLVLAAAPQDPGALRYYVKKTCTAAAAAGALQAGAGVVLAVPVAAQAARLGADGDALALARAAHLPGRVGQRKRLLGRPVCCTPVQGGAGGWQSGERRRREAAAAAARQGRQGPTAAF